MQKLSKEIIKFSYKKTTRRPKRLENNVFIIYSPETIKLEPGDHKLINNLSSKRNRRKLQIT